MVVTDDGVVIMDTPQLPTRAVAMREEAESHGPIRYVINTEHHVDHIFGNYYFRGAGLVVHHQGVADNFMEVTPALDSFDYAHEAIPTDDPEGEAIFPDREDYFADPNNGKIVFTGDLTLTGRGPHLRAPPHARPHPGQIAVHVPEERVVFTGDTIFSECQTWLMGSNVTEWLTALDRIAKLDVDWVVPGHGEVVTMSTSLGSEPTSRLGHGRHRRRGEGVVPRGDRRAGQLRRPLPGRHRAGLHDEPHPDPQRRLDLGQDHRALPA